jgi:hypothetical protein
MREILLDLIVDIRCADRDGLTDYAAQQRAEFRRFWKVRHTARLDRCGWPILPVTPNE